MAKVNHHLPSDCRPIAQILARVGDKWSILLLNVLGEETMRFKDLHRAVPGISQRMLTVTLRNLERDVWARIDAEAALRPLPQRWVAALCCGAALIFSATGASLAVASASAPVHAVVFNAHAPLAPSTLLGD